MKGVLGAVLMLLLSPAAATGGGRVDLVAGLGGQIGGSRDQGTTLDLGLRFAQVWADGGVGLQVDRAVLGGGEREIDRGRVFAMLVVPLSAHVAARLAAGVAVPHRGLTLFSGAQESQRSVDPAFEAAIGYAFGARRVKVVLEAAVAAGGFQWPDEAMQSGVDLVLRIAGRFAP